MPCAIVGLLVIVAVAIPESTVPASAKGASGIICFREPAPNGVSSQRGVVVFNVDTKAFTWLVLNPSATAHLHNALSPDGRHLAYGTLAENADGGSGPHADIHVKPIGDPGPGRWLGVQADSWCWSPDSKTLLVSRQTVRGIEHSLVNVETGVPQRFKLPALEAKTKPRRYAGFRVTDWSNDGKWLLGAYWSGEKHERSRLYRVSTDGSCAELIEAVEAGGSPRLPPDGHRILYATSEGLSVVDLQTGKSYSVATEKDGCRLGHCWSPDGKRIAYGWRQQIENRMQDEEVFLMVVDADGGNLSVLHSEKSFFPGLFVTGWR